MAAATREHTGGTLEGSEVFPKVAATDPSGAGSIVVTPPIPSRNTRAGRAYNDLRNLARRDGRDPGEYLTLYTLEGFLARLAASEYAGDFVLKGGALLPAFATRRPTRDIDLAASGFTNEVPEVEKRIRRIVNADVDDGLLFDPKSVEGMMIREGAQYTGIRTKIAARLETARIGMHIDVNFGDPIWPEPTMATIPLLLGGPSA